MTSPFWSLLLCSVLICGQPIGQSVIYTRRCLFLNISLHITHIIGERAKRARHSQVCSIENRGYIYYILLYIVRAIFVLITRKVGGA